MKRKKRRKSTFKRGYMVTRRHIAALRKARMAGRARMIPAQFAGLPFLLKVRGQIVAGFRDKKRALQYGRKLSRHERAPVSLMKR